MAEARGGGEGGGTLGLGATGGPLGEGAVALEAEGEGPRGGGGGGAGVGVDEAVEEGGAGHRGDPCDRQPVPLHQRREEVPRGPPPDRPQPQPNASARRMPGRHPCLPGTINTGDPFDGAKRHRDGEGATDTSRAPLPMHCHPHLGTSFARSQSPPPSGAPLRGGRGRCPLRRRSRRHPAGRSGAHIPPQSPHTPAGAEGRGVQVTPPHRRVRSLRLHPLSNDGKGGMPPPPPLQNRRHPSPGHGRPTAPINPAGSSRMLPPPWVRRCGG